MLRFYADKFMEALNNIESLQSIAARDPAWVFGDPTRRTHLSNQLQVLITELQTLGLKVAAKKAAVFVTTLTLKPDPEQFAGMSRLFEQNLAAIKEIIQIELEDKALFVVSSHATYLDENDQPFGPVVAERFPSAVYDIAEAAKCLALKRYTACVFHLMRVVEIGIRQLGDALKIEISPNAGWLVIINEKLEPAINLLPEKTPGEKSRKKELQQARGHLHAIRLGWRNDTMHPKATYTEEEAENLVGHVKTFMKHLVDHLDASLGPEVA